MADHRDRDFLRRRGAPNHHARNYPNGLLPVHSHGETLRDHLGLEVFAMSRDSADDVAKIAMNSYTYLRLGVVGVLSGLAIAVAWQMHVSGCAQKSISAYYYTPVRSVFVGALLAIALALVALSSRNTVEEAFLNLAGLFAPVVAFAPTQVANLCSVKAGTKSETTLVDSAHPAINNNMIAYFAVVIIACLFLTFLKRLEQARDAITSTDAEPGQKPRGLRDLLTSINPDPDASDVVFGASYTLAFLTWLAGLLWFIFGRDSFYAHAHMTSAILLFTCLIVVVFANAFAQLGHNDTGEEDPAAFLRNLPGRIAGCITETFYGLLGALMVAAALIIYAIGKFADLDHTILLIETSLILLFIFFWGYQTYELAFTAPGASPAATQTTASTRRKAPDPPEQVADDQAVRSRAPRHASAPRGLPQPPHPAASTLDPAHSPDHLDSSSPSSPSS
jgi:hypothetical protein